MNPKQAIIFLLLATAAPSWAAEAEIVSSSLPGVVMTSVAPAPATINGKITQSGTEAWVYLEDEAAKASAKLLLDQCRTGGRLYVYEAGATPFHCHLPHSDADDQGVGMVLTGYKTTVTGVLTLSLKPFTRQHWATSTPSPATAKELYRLASRHYSALGKENMLAQGDYKQPSAEQQHDYAWKLPLKEASYYFVPFAIQTEDEFGEPSFCWHTAVIREVAGKPTFYSDFDGAVTDFVDITGDRTPALRTIQCDLGNREAYVRLSPNAEELMSWENPND